MKSSSPKPSLIDSEKVGDYVAWQPPSVQIPTEKDLAEEERQRMVTAESIEVLQKQAYKEGYTQGFQKGIDDGNAKINEQVARLQNVLNMLNQPLAEMDETVVDQMVELSITIAKMLIRRELKTDPGQIVAVVRESVSALPAGTNHIRVMLNPEDAELIRETMSLSEGEKGWEIFDDPLLRRGGCKIVTDTSEIDASVESRLSAIIAQVLGGERHDDRSTED